MVKACYVSARMAADALTDYPLGQKRPESCHYAVRFAT